MHDIIDVRAQAMAEIYDCQQELWCVVHLQHLFSLQWRSWLGIYGLCNNLIRDVNVKVLAPAPAMSWE